VTPEELTSKYMKVLDTKGKGVITKSDFFEHMEEVLDVGAVHKWLASYTKIA